MKHVQQHPDLELQVIVGASALLNRFGSAIDVIRQDGFSVNGTVYMIIEGENPTTMAKSTGLAILELATLFENLKPDIVITVADRFETIATAIAASYMNIPLAHTQGGEITGSIDESVRHAITKLAHLHFVSSKLSAERVLKMGESKDAVYITGCPSLDVLVELDLRITGELRTEVEILGVGGKLDLSKDYIVVLQHPVTTEYGNGRRQIEETLMAIYDLKIPTIWLWPNVDAGSDDISKGIRAFREKHNPAFIHFHKNFTVENYARLIYNSKCLVGNSSSGIREGAFLGIPVVNIGTRQGGRERGENVTDVGHDRRQITEAVKTQIAHGRYPKNTVYGDGYAGKRIAEILSTCQAKIQKRLTY
jgi:UDP-hydrolysing UDP-N-acetyl-D-glucosamine 2-epimerase